MTAITSAEPEYFAGGELAPEQHWVFFRRLLSKKIATLALIYLVIFYGAGIIGPFVAPHDPNKQELTIQARLAGPSLDHPFGTDALGRDLFSRVLSSARTTIIFTAIVILSGEFFVGLGLGLLAGYRGGNTDTAIMRTGEVLAGIPTLILMLAIAASFRQRIDDLAYWLQVHTWLGPDAKLWVKFTIVVGVAVPFSWVGASRIVRGQVLSMRESTYVLAAEAMGASTWRIIWHHLLPGILPIFIVGLSSSMAGIAGIEVALSYLGLGIDPPAASFGTLIGDAGGVRTLQDHPHLLIASALPVVLFFFAWNLLGDALVDVFEPRTNRR